MRMRANLPETAIGSGDETLAFQNFKLPNLR